MITVHNIQMLTVTRNKILIFQFFIFFMYVKLSSFYFQLHKLIAISLITSNVVFFVELSFLCAVMSLNLIEFSQANNFPIAKVPFTHTGWCRLYHYALFTASNPYNLLHNIIRYTFK